MSEVKNVMKGNKVELPKETVYESGLEGPVGIALALIRESEPHYHNEMTEWYLVTKGSAKAYLDGKEVYLKEYDVLKIPPRTVHYVKAEKEIELWVITQPPWKPEDHHRV